MRHLSNLTNLALRGSTLALRFGLNFYVIKLLGLEAAGIYALAIGAIGIVPAVLGWGLNYFLAREIVGYSPASAITVIRDRMLVTIGSLAVVTIAFCAIMPVVGYPMTLMIGLIIALIWLEALTIDLHLALLGLEMAFQANVLVFIRTALWIVPMAVIGLWWPSTRTLDAVFAAWLIGHAVALVVLMWFIRGWPLARIAQVPIDRAWIRTRLSRSWMIYFSDLGLVGLIYLDRYIVGAMLGLTLTGIYTFYWSLANALQTLVQTAIVQVALPALVRAAQLPDRAAWFTILKREMRLTLAFAVLTGGAVYVASQMLMGRLSMTGLREHQLIFILLLAAAVIRACSDLLNVALASRNRDGQYAGINIGGVFLSVGAAFVGIRLFGLNGAGMAALLTALVLLAVRIGLLVDARRPDSSAPFTAPDLAQLSAEHIE